MLISTETLQLVVQMENLITATLWQKFVPLCAEMIEEQVAFQSNANHSLAESMGHIKFEGM